jgi:hypothetical protein
MWPTVRLTASSPFLCKMALGPATMAVPVAPCMGDIACSTQPQLARREFGRNVTHSTPIIPPYVSLLQGASCCSGRASTAPADSSRGDTLEISEGSLARQMTMPCTSAHKRRTHLCPALHPSLVISGRYDSAADGLSHILCGATVAPLCRFSLCMCAVCMLWPPSACCRCKRGLKHSTAQHSTAQHSTAQHSTAQHSRTHRAGCGAEAAIREVVRQFDSCAGAPWQWVNKQPGEQAAIERNCLSG